MGLRCLTVRVSDRELRHLISTGCLSLERSEEAPAVAFAALELTLPATLLSRDMLIPIMCPTCRHIGATSAARLPRKLVCFVCKAGHAFDFVVDAAAPFVECLFLLQPAGDQSADDAADDRRDPEQPKRPKRHAAAENGFREQQTRAPKPDFAPAKSGGGVLAAKASCLPPPPRPKTGRSQ